jgi:hypothetical protein
VARYQNGAEYTGDFCDDGRHGWGLQTFPTGDRYEGEWAADKIHGEPGRQGRACDARHALPGALASSVQLHPRCLLKKAWLQKRFF